MRRRPGLGHNAGPPLDDYRGPPWGKGDAYVFLSWKKAHRMAWRAPSRDVMLMRLDRAERFGLTYEEYNLEILERGRYLQADDAERVAEIKRNESVGRPGIFRSDERPQSRRHQSATLPERGRYNL